jgi:hypothetical protein
MAAGVFLWVSLVIRSLLAGLVNGDRVSDVQRRLAFIRPDLEKLYEKMLDGLDPFYLEHASQISSLSELQERRQAFYTCLSRMRSLSTPTNVRWGQ